MERESEIVGQSGRKGAITIATNMAGRGTDIILGGNPDYMARYICHLQFYKRLVIILIHHVCNILEISMFSLLELKVHRIKKPAKRCCETTLTTQPGSYFIMATLATWNVNDI